MNLVQQIITLCAALGMAGMLYLMQFAKQSPEPALEELWTDIYAEELPQGSAAENA